MSSFAQSEYSDSEMLCPMWLKTLWFRRVPVSRDRGIDYLFWYFDGSDQLLHTTCVGCESDASAIHEAKRRTRGTDSWLEIYQTKGARIVYRGNPLAAKDREAASCAVAAGANGVLDRTAR